MTAPSSLTRSIKYAFLAFVAFVAVGLFFAANSQQSKAINWGGGWYTNLCGSIPNRTGNNYACNSGCNPYSGSCSGPWVIKFTCNGQHTECGGSGPTPVEETSGGYQQFDSWRSNQTQQIDLFSKNCRAGGGWSCGSNDLLGFMVWYHPQTCQNTCSGYSSPWAYLGSPTNGTMLSSTWVNFNWGLGGAGSCGGDTCAGTCRGPSSFSYTLTIQGLTNGYYNVIGTGSSTSTAFALTGGTYRWMITVYGSCNGSSSTGWNTFTIDNPPTVSAAITSAQTCLGQAASAGLSGEHAARASAQGRPGGINNPVRIRATYTDPDGIADLSHLYIWLANNNYPISGQNINNVGFGRLLVTGYNTFSLSPYRHGNDTITPTPFSPGSGWAICSDGTQTQFLCNIFNLAAYPGAISFAYPASITPSGNSYIVEWDIGLLSSTYFGPVSANPSGGLYASATVMDRYNVWNVTGWQASGTWRADLLPPATAATVSYLSPNSFRIAYSAPDNNPIAGTTGKSKNCTATSLSSNVTLTQTNNPGAGSRVFSTANPTYNPCFAVDEGTFNYSVSNIPTNMNFEFTYTATDLACNQQPRTTRVGLLRPWLMTTDGDMFVNNNFSQTSLANITAIGNPLIDTTPSLINAGNTSPRLSNLFNNNTIAPYLSTFSYYDNFSVSGPARASRLNTLLLRYPDKNGKPPADTNFANWYDYLWDRVNVLIPDTSRIKNVAGASAYFGTTSGHILTSNIPTNNTTPANGYGSAADNLANRIVVVKVERDLRVQNLVCNNKIIFFVPGNLRIDPDIDIADGPAVPNSEAWSRSNQNGCLFIVKGTTTVTEGNLK